MKAAASKTKKMTKNYEDKKDNDSCCDNPDDNNDNDNSRNTNHTAKNNNQNTRMRLVMILIIVVVVEEKVEVEVVAVVVGGRRRSFPLVRRRFERICYNTPFLDLSFCMASALLLSRVPKNAHPGLGDSAFSSGGDIFLVGAQAK